MFSVTHHWWRRRKRECESDSDKVDNLLPKRFNWEWESEYIESLLTTVYSWNTKQVVEKMGKVGEVSWQNGFRICWKDPECSVTQKILFTQLPLVRDQLLWGHISTAITLTESFLKVTFSFSCFCILTPPPKPEKNKLGEKITCSEDVIIELQHLDEGAVEEELGVGDRICPIFPHPEKIFPHHERILSHPEQNISTSWANISTSWKNIFTPWKNISTSSKNISKVLKEYF